MNKSGATKGVISAKDQAKLRKENTIVVNAEPKHKAAKRQLPPQEFTYGIMNRPSTPIDGVISNSYGQYAEQVADEMYKRSTQKPEKQTKKPVRTTKATEKLLEHQKIKDSPSKNDKVDNFKIKRFTKVESRVKAQLKHGKKSKENQAPAEEVKQD